MSQSYRNDNSDSKYFHDLHIDILGLSSSYEKDWSTGLKTSSSIVGFDFGNQAFFSWSKITCYFLTKDGKIFYLTPCVPSKFAISSLFFQKLATN